MGQPNSQQDNRLTKQLGINLIAENLIDSLLQRDRRQQTNMTTGFSSNIKRIAGFLVSVVIDVNSTKVFKTERTLND